MSAVAVDVKPKTLFGREPAAWAGFIESLLGTLLAFGVGLNQTTYGPIIAVVTAALGLYVAWGTKDTWLSAIIGFTKSLFVLGAVYGLTFTDQQTAAIVIAITSGFSFLNRTQTSPLTKDDNVLADPVPVVVDTPPTGVQPEPAAAEEAPAYVPDGADDDRFEQGH